MTTAATNDYFLTNQPTVVFLINLKIFGAQNVGNSEMA